MITSRHRLRVLAAASGLAALALLGTACGGGSSGGDGKEKASGANTTGREGGPSMDQQLKFAKCMRENGVDVPDPKPGEDSRAVTIGGSGASQEKVEKAMKTCQKSAGIPAPKPISQAEKDKMIKLARCMRGHGVDMPDPKFDDRGAAGAAIQLPSSGAEKDKFEKANKACGAQFG